MGVVVFILLFMPFSCEEGRSVVRIMAQNTEVLTVLILKVA